MSAAGWGIESWGTDDSQWGGNTCSGGWGVQLWGTSVYGGCSIVPPQPIEPPQQIGDFSRWQKVHREPRIHHEPATVRSVLFKVEGVAAKVRLGRPVCSTGYGTAVRLRHSWRSQCAVGAVAIQTGTGTWAQAQAARSACECGAVEAGVSVRCEISEGVSGNTNVGLAKVRAIKNPTDEEFLMMLAEMI
jgi:hypothetical protein